MKPILAALALSLFSQMSFADMIAIDCKNTKVPGIRTINLQNTSDFGRSGSTATGRYWALTINEVEVTNARVQVIKKDGGVSAFRVNIDGSHSLFFALASESKAFMFLLSPRGTRVPDTTSYCSVAID